MLFLCVMVYKNLLIALKLGDIDHYLFKDFLGTLPEKSMVFDSFGYIGVLEKNLKKSERGNRMRFAIFQSPIFNELNTEYFASTPEAFFNEIPDRLKVKINYKVQDSEFLNGAMTNLIFNGTINEMIKKYNDLLLMDPKKLFTNNLDNDKVLRENVTKKKRFGKTKILPTYVSVGLETSDEKYLIGFTGVKGPYYGTLKK